MLYGEFYQTKVVQSSCLFAGVLSICKAEPILEHFETVQNLVLVGSRVSASERLVKEDGQANEYFI